MGSSRTQFPIESEPWVYPSKAPANVGFQVIVVGAGIGGLSLAIECRLRGFEVKCFDQVKEFMRIGDTIGIMPNSAIHLYRQGLYPILRPKCGNAKGITINRYDGKWLTDQIPPPGAPEPPPWRIVYDAHRGDLHGVLYDKAKEVGVEILQPVQISKYSEDASSASISYSNPDTEQSEEVTIKADVVIGADGVKSLARETVLGFTDQPKPSGYAIFRAFFPGDRIREDPICGHLVEARKDKRTVWIGPDIHMIAAGVRDTAEFSWVMTHKDAADVQEGWTQPGKKEEAAKTIEGWDPVLKRLIELTPDENLLDWKLVYRDPLPTWVSTNGRIALMGDAAHPFLPTSIQGAGMSIEDAVTIATVLELAFQSRGDATSQEKEQKTELGKVEIKEALRAYEAIRYERVCKTQKLGEEVRDKWHKIADWDNIDPEAIKLSYSPSLFNHDATEEAKNKFTETIVALREHGYSQPGNKYKSGWTSQGPKDPSTSDLS